MADPGVTPSAPPGPRPKQMPKRGIHKEDEVQVVASCPEDHHDQVMNICKGSGMLKAFGKQGDFIDQLKSGARWFDLWKAKVCQTVLVATMHAECSVVRIFCIEGGPHCDEEFRTIPDLKKAVTDDMKKQNGREVEVVCEWMTMELFERDFGSHVKPDGKERKARLLGILDKDPQLAESVAIMKKHVSEEALRTCKRVVIIGETGAGKSAFCGLLEGSLEFVDGHWTSTFKLGHGGSSETNEPKLLAAQWRVRDDVLPILLVDTPGLGDSRGPQKDDEHMAEVARWVNGLGHVHAMVILLKNETRISHSLRENLQFFQRRFGKKMWDHTLMVVNKWSHETKAQKKRKAGKLQSAKQFEEEFRQMLQQDASGDGEDSDLGVGLSKERAEKVPFFFVDTHYDRDDEDEVKSMENELREMKRWLRSLLEWKVGANSQSEELKDLIHAVKTTGLAEPLKEALQTALNVARRSSPPKDLTQEKLDAVEEEIRCRRQDERLEEAKSVLSDFQRTGRKEDADSFLKKLDAVNQPTMPVSSETDYLAQIGELLRLALAGEPIHEKRMHFPELSGAFQQHLEALMEHGKKQKDAESRIQTIFKRWNIQETKEVVTEVARWAIEKGVCEEADLVLIIDPMPALTTVGQTRITLLRDWYHYKDSAGYDLKKVKEIQERALRANVEQEVLDDIKAKQKKDSALEKLKEAISEESTEKAGPCLADCEALNVSAEELEFAKKWLEAAKHKENGVDQLQRALNKNDSNEVEEALKYATTVCSVPEDHQKVREARMWLKERKREEEKRKQEEDPEQVEADEAAAAKYDDIARAALNGDLPAVRGHLRRDRGSLDRLFDGVAALHCAAYNGHRAIVAFLVAKGAAVDVPGLGRDTPLHQAARYGRVECAQLLLAAKASVHIKDIAGRTPLDFAREQGHTEIVNLLMAKA